MRRSLLLLAAVVPFAAVATAHGCSDEPPFESACRWIEDPENCFREFHEDMLSAKGPDNLNGDCRTYPPLPKSAWPTEASSAGPGVSNGTFQKRAMLDTCILTGGGQVTVNPPIDLTMWPPSPYADPVTYTFSFVNPDGNECGSATYSSPHGFSITIDPPPDAGSTAMADAGVDAPATPADGGPEMEDGGSYLPYGTYTQVNPPGRDSFDVTCPSGESHHFTLDEVDITNPDAGACPQYAGILPSASMQIYLGGVDTPGALSFAITYPPPSPTSGSEAYPDGGAALQGDKIVYFNCAIPGAMETCMDTAQDGLETDTDCGGPQIPTHLYCGMCPPRCATMQKCLCNADCDQQAGLVCAVNSMDGMRQCVPKAMGGEGFPVCSWATDAGAPSCTGGTGTGGSSGTGGSGSGTGGSGTGGSGSGGSGSGGAGGSAPADAGAG